MSRLYIFAFMTLIICTVCSAEPNGSTNNYRFAFNQDAIKWPIDLSYLNHPLTSHDKVYVCGNHFCTVGNDDEPRTNDDKRIRFFGVNLVYSANFPTAIDAMRIAKRLRALGINIVRLHNLDGLYNAPPTTIRSILTSGPYPTFNDVALSRLRYFIRALSEQGIYVDIDLYVGYNFRPNVDKIPTTPLPGKTRQLAHFYPALINKEITYTQQLLSRLHLKDNPALAMVEISNESSLIYSWRTGDLEKAAVGPYRQYLQQLWYQYTGQRSTNWLVPGDNKTDAITVNFLEWLDGKYFDAMRKAVHSVTSQYVPVTGTQMNFGGLSNIDSQSHMDYADSHFYVDSYIFGRTTSTIPDWRIRNISIATGGLEHLINAAYLRPNNKPYSISEYNEPWPNTHGAEIAPFMAYLGSVQDWDALTFFAYSHSRNWDVIGPHSFDLIADYSKLSNIGQAAWVFRTGAIHPSSIIECIPMSASERLTSTLWRVKGKHISEYLEKEKAISPDTALFTRVSIVPTTGDSNPSTCSTHSDKLPNPLHVTNSNGRIIIDYAGAEGIFGLVFSRETIAFRSGIRVKNESSRQVSVNIFITPTDNKPLNESNQILISSPGALLPGEVENNAEHPVSLSPYLGLRGWWTLHPSTKAWTNFETSTSLNYSQQPSWMTAPPIMVALVGRKMAAESVTGNNFIFKNQNKINNYFKFGNSPWLLLHSTDN